MTDDEWYLVLCRKHGLVQDGIEGRSFAHRVADQHENPRCDIRVLTERQWEELKKAGELKPSAGGNTAFTGP